MKDIKSNSVNFKNGNKGKEWKEIRNEYRSYLNIIIPRNS